MKRSDLPEDFRAWPKWALLILFAVWSPFIILWRVFWIALAEFKDCCLAWLLEANDIWNLEDDLPKDR